MGGRSIGRCTDVRRFRCVVVNYLGNVLIRISRSFAQLLQVAHLEVTKRVTQVVTRFILSTTVVVWNPSYL
jgi:hypothetical protein